MGNQDENQGRNSGNRNRRPYNKSYKGRSHEHGRDMDGVLQNEGRGRSGGDHYYRTETLSDLIMYPFHKMHRFMLKEISGGIFLVVASLLAIWASNSGFAQAYEKLLHLNLGLNLGSLSFELGLQHFVNDALMVVFFLLVGLEIKREFVDGELSSRKQASLPLAAAVCGMAVPALIYVMFNFGDSTALRGWAIPSATDIAFAIGIMALLGKRAPFSLKVLLVAIAVIDDLGAILVIAIFYAEGLDYQLLLLAGGILLVLLFLNKRGVSNLTPYMFFGFLLWIVVLKSGIHATLAGVLTALTIPLYVKGDRRRSPLKKLEHSISPWVTFIILPIFGFTNAGISFAGMGSIGDLFASPITLGILLGLVVGKQLGIFSAIFVMVKLGLGAMPRDTHWGHIYAMSILCGIGFTMSLFIGSLAFVDGSVDIEVRIGVFVGSLISAFAGYVLLMVFSQGEEHRQGTVRRRRSLKTKTSSAPRHRRNYNSGGGRSSYRGERRDGGQRSSSYRSGGRRDDRPSDHRDDRSSDRRDDRETYGDER